MAPRHNTRSKNLTTVGKLDSGRNSPWSRDEKQALLDAIKEGKRQNLKFKPSEKLHSAEETWDEIADAVEPHSIITERTPFRCRQHYNNLRKNMERILVALKSEGISWDERTHKLIGSDDAFEDAQIKAGTSIHRSRAFPYLKEIMGIEGVKAPKGMPMTPERDDEDEEMVDAEDAEEKEEGKDNKKGEKQEDKTEKAGKEESAKPDDKKGKGKGKTTGDGEDDEDEGKRPEKKANLKPGKATKKRQKKSEATQGKESNDQVGPKSKDKNAVVDAPSSPNGGLEGEVVQIPTSDFSDPKSSRNEHKKPAQRVAAPKAKKGKKSKKADSSEDDTSHNEGEDLAEQILSSKKTKKKRKERASSSGPPSPTTSRSSKQPKNSEAFHTAGLKKKASKPGSSSGASRGASPVVEDPALPVVEEEANGDGKGRGKGKTDRDAPQMATPVKTSPVPRRTADDENEEPKSDVEAEITPQERAQNEVWEDTMLTNAGRAAMARLFRTDEDEAKEYLRIMANIERCRAYLEEALVSLDKDVGRCMM